jgi:hypothetical protein
LSAKSLPSINSIFLEEFPSNLVEDLEGACQITPKFPTHLGPESPAKMESNSSREWPKETKLSHDRLLGQLGTIFG